MRTKKELQLPEFADDLTELSTLLTKKSIKHKLRKHPLVVAEPEAKELMGYWPSGKWQIIIGDRKYSIIRGMASFGNYEIMNMGKGKKFKDPEKFTTPEELVKQLIS